MLWSYLASGGEGGDACDGLDFSLEVSRSSILPMPCPLASHSTPPRIFAAHGKYQGHGLLSMFEFVEIDPPMFCSYHIYLNDIYNTAYTHTYTCVYVCTYVNMCVCVPVLVIISQHLLSTHSVLRIVLISVPQTLTPLIFSVTL